MQTTLTKPCPLCHLDMRPVYVSRKSHDNMIKLTMTGLIDHYFCMNCKQVYEKEELECKQQ